MRKICVSFFKKWLVSKIALTFKTHMQLFFRKGQIVFEFFLYRQGTWSRDFRTSSRSNYSLNHWCSILYLPTYQSALYLFHVSSGDFTKVEMNAIERTLNNSCSQSLARKRDSWKLESIFSKHFSAGWIQLVPNLSLLKYFDITLPRQKSYKIEGSGPPLSFGKWSENWSCYSLFRGRWDWKYWIQR